MISKSGLRVAFDDDKKIITIDTPGKNSVVMDDDAKSICLKDQHGNEITMDSNGITLKSAKDFNVDASGKVVIKGSTVDVQ
ncbi:MAG: hypothetical protein JNK04_26255 [Myxococcales bacterium]|nr:hypothetical protein [Myxococcales bacterium]